MKSDFLFFTLLLISHSLHAQFRTKAELEKVQENGFYKIAVTPELSAHCRTDLSDLRILGTDGHEVPYIVRTYQPVLSASDFIDCAILSQQHDSNKTVLEFDVRNLNGTDKLSLTMGNTSVERYTSLSGSRDQKNWFIIEDHILLQASGTNTDGSFIQSINFPFVRYPYLKLVIRNEHNDPLNIQRAGIFQKITKDGGPLFVPNTLLSFSQTDSNKHSIVVIFQKESYPVDRIILYFDSAPFYQREASLLIPSSLGKGLEAVSTFTLSSDSLPVISVDQLKAERLVLNIDNQDNPPLKLKSVITEQIQKYLVAYLEKGKIYRLLTDNPGAGIPQYDLVRFGDRIPEHLSSINFGQLTPNNQASPSTQSGKYWLWIVLIFGIAILVFSSFRLIKELKTRESHSE